MEGGGCGSNGLCVAWRIVGVDEGGGEEEEQRPVRCLGVDQGGSNGLCVTWGWWEEGVTACLLLRGGGRGVGGGSNKCLCFCVREKSRRQQWLAHYRRIRRCDGRNGPAQ